MIGIALVILDSSFHRQRAFFHDISLSFYPFCSCIFIRLIPNQTLFGKCEVEAGSFLGKMFWPGLLIFILAFLFKFSPPGKIFLILLNHTTEYDETGRGSSKLQRPVFFFLGACIHELML